jgi:DNA-binding MarR family transcriptional regulator
VTKASPHPLDRADLVVGLERLVSLVRLLGPAGQMSLTTASTLARLATTGPQRLSDLAAREGVTQPAMTQLVSRLETQELAERRGDPDDGRVVMVHITDAGRRVVGERRAHRAGRLSTLLDQLSEDEERSIAEALPALQRLTELGRSTFEETR